LKDVDGFETRDFESLEDGGKYTLGDVAAVTARRAVFQVAVVV